jgi:hypothetical protein
MPVLESIAAVIGAVLLPLVLLRVLVLAERRLGK